MTETSNGRPEIMGREPDQWEALLTRVLENRDYRSMKKIISDLGQEIREERKRDMQILSEEIAKKTKKQIRKRNQSEYERIRDKLGQDMKFEIRKKIEKLIKPKRTRKKK